MIRSDTVKYRWNREDVCVSLGGAWLVHQSGVRRMHVACTEMKEGSLIRNKNKTILKVLKNKRVTRVRGWDRIGQSTIREKGRKPISDPIRIVIVHQRAVRDSDKRTSKRHPRSGAEGAHRVARYAMHLPRSRGWWLGASAPMAPMPTSSGEKGREKKKRKEISRVAARHYDGR